MSGDRDILNSMLPLHDLLDAPDGAGLDVPLHYLSLGTRAMRGLVVALDRMGRPKTIHGALAISPRDVGFTKNVGPLTVLDVIRAVRTWLEEGREVAGEPGKPGKRDPRFSLRRRVVARLVRVLDGKDDAAAVAAARELRELGEIAGA